MRNIFRKSELALENRSAAARVNQPFAGDDSFGVVAEGELDPMKGIGKINVRDPRLLD